MTDDQLHREVARMARELADKDCEIERLRAERDEARREVCEHKAWNFYGVIKPEDYARLRKWDCFKEAT